LIKFILSLLRKTIKSTKYKNLAKEYIKNINQDVDDIKINIKIIKNKYNMLLI